MFGLLYLLILKVRKFLKQIFLLSFTPKNPKLFPEFCPKDFKWVKSKKQRQIMHKSGDKFVDF